MKKLLLIVAVMATAALPALAGKGWSRHYVVANGLTFQRIFSDEDPTGSTVRMIAGSQYNCEHYGELDQYGRLVGNPETPPGGGDNYRQVGAEVYDQPSYVIPSLAGGYPVVEIQGAFYKNTYIKDITFPEANLTTLPSNCFDGCTSLERLHFDGSCIKVIPSYCFRNCAFTTVENWGMVEDIQSGAFYDCDKLESLTITPGIRHVAGSGFFGCDELKTLVFTDGDEPLHLDYSQNLPFWSSVLEDIYFGRKMVIDGREEFNSLPFGQLPGLKHVEFGAAFDIIPERIFQNCQSTFEVKAPYAKHVGPYAFSGSKLNGFDAPLIESIGAYAFDACPIEEFNFYGVQTIDNYAFRNTRLVDVMLPATLRSVGLDAFSTKSSSSSRLKTLTIVDGDEPLELGYDSSQEQYRDSEEWDSKYQYMAYGQQWLAHSNVEELYIGRPLAHEPILTDGMCNKISQYSSYTFFGDATKFGGCKKLRKVSLPRWHTLADGAFNGCDNLEEAYLPELTELPNSSFYYCTKLATVDVPKVTKIWGYALCKTGLTEFTISPDVTYVGLRAFNGCDQLKSFTIAAANQPLVMENGTRYNETRRFWDYALALEDLHIDRDVVNEDDTPVVISAYTTFDYTGVQMLKTVEIGANVRSLNGYRFTSNTIETFRCKNTEPVPLTPYEDDAEQKTGNFVDATLQQTATLVVPAGSVEHYAAAPVWKGFMSIVPDKNGEFDTNDDDIVDVGDVNAILDDILDTGGTSLELDVNHDGKVDVGDVNAVLAAILVQ